MKKIIAIVLTVVLLAMGLGAGIVSADPPVSQSGGEVTTAGALSLDGTWLWFDVVIPAPGFFPGGPWTWTSALPVKFTITDLFVVGDEFEVWDSGSFVAATPDLPDYVGLGIGAYDSPPWTGDPDTALADGRFSSAVLYFAPGSHSIEIKATVLPPSFSDSTVAFKAETIEVPDIDIKPWSDPNSVNRNKKGVIPVALLGSELFDPSLYDPSLLSFAFCGADETAHVITDPAVFADHLVYPWEPDPIGNPGYLVTANDDEYTDLVVHFYVSEIDCLDSYVRNDVVPVDLTVTYMGETFTTTTDDIRIVK